MEIVLVLGKRCNLNCKYCNESELKICDSGKIKKSVILYMNSVADRILFYGGEPLLYWDTLCEVVEQTPTIKHRAYSNGILLDEKKVKYCNDKNIEVLLSYDGISSKELRGINIIDKNKNNILNLNHLSMWSVITNKNYIKDVLNELNSLEKEYYNIHGYYFNIEMAPLQPNVSLSKKTKGMEEFDYGRLDKEMKEIINGYNENIAYKQYIDAQRKYFNLQIPNDGLHCGFRYQRLVIDRQGNYFPCVGYDNIVGNIIETSIQDALKSINKFDKHPERYDTICKKCKAYPICKNGCIAIKYHLDIYCKLRQHIYAPIIEFLNTLEDEE